MANASNIQLKDDVVCGRHLHSRLIKFAKDHPELGGSGAWDLLWLWQCWQERVLAHLDPEDRQTFMSLKSSLARRVESLAYLAGCLASELEYLENLWKSCKHSPSAERNPS
jgi:hypothetical protein